MPPADDPLCHRCRRLARAGSAPPTTPRSRLPAAAGPPPGDTHDPIKRRPHRAGRRDPPTPSPSSARSRRAALAAASGTAVEYYEFGVYGYLAVVIGPLFFPSADPVASLLSTLAVFGSAFLMRPLGGIVLGRLGDRLGRKPVLVFTITGMGTATALVGLLPTAATAGLLAPALLVLARLAQGFLEVARIDHSWVAAGCRW
ncbi:L-Proline/Glycine betaine transporter ProP [Pseudonocardia sp. Ae717_Ps2]|uniref:MFS transporter n=1 Tax=Pseudonocardia sp. Ae717_Ps2 TaxID=1885573 RepID=UPI00094B0E75|nr:MFS transporter [Pseudonocardia sp. Ae717_Ps2]OLM30138.1 L-Proline/Glycine betaine transporter ProP [Pseudonocardia sp. Ae717_Ps2]